MPDQRFQVPGERVKGNGDGAALPRPAAKECDGLCVGAQARVGPSERALQPQLLLEQGAKVGGDGAAEWGWGGAGRGGG